MCAFGAADALDSGSGHAAAPQAVRNDVMVARTFRLGRCEAEDAHPALGCHACASRRPVSAGAEGARREQPPAFRWRRWGLARTVRGYWFPVFGCAETGTTPRESGAASPPPADAALPSRVVLPATTRGEDEAPKQRCFDRERHKEIFISLLLCIGFRPINRAFAGCLHPAQAVIRAGRGPKGPTRRQTRHRRSDPVGGNAGDCRRPFREIPVPDPCRTGECCSKRKASGRYA
ncbi:hypothetical protein SAMN05421512_110219 [Stappia indica]|uniref:Uncharacterized protein n=1 Tax=Stappia indica TaxID=538381 RepID=A0A285TEN1_9HYPH|nr:hypothetical protein SAMN05421512_110219 [Stappia indica]